MHFWNIALSYYQILSMEGKQQNDTGDIELGENLASGIQASIMLATNIALHTTEEKGHKNWDPHLPLPYTPAELNTYQQQHLQECLFSDKK